MMLMSWVIGSHLPLALSTDHSGLLRLLQEEVGNEIFVVCPKGRSAFYCK